MDAQLKKLKTEFIRQYKDRILLHFDYGVFLDSDDIGLRETSRTLKDICLYFTPWYQKNGTVEHRIEVVLADEGYRAIRVREAKEYPAAYMSNGSSIGRSLIMLWPLPIATDLKLGKTLLLDSNCTIQSLLTGHEIDLLEEVPVIEIFGDRLHRLNPDFKVLER